MNGVLAFFVLNSTLCKALNDLGLNIKHSLTKGFYCVGPCIYLYGYSDTLPSSNLFRVWECSDASMQDPDHLRAFKNAYINLPNISQAH